MNKSMALVTLALFSAVAFKAAAEPKIGDYYLVDGEPLQVKYISNQLDRTDMISRPVVALTDGKDTTRVFSLHTINNSDKLSLKPSSDYLIRVEPTDGSGDRSDAKVGPHASVTGAQELINDITGKSEGWVASSGFGTEIISAGKLNKSKREKIVSLKDLAQELRDVPKWISFMIYPSALAKMYQDAKESGNSKDLLELENAMASRQGSDALASTLPDSRVLERMTFPLPTNPMKDELVGEIIKRTRGAVEAGR